jgi:acetyltransferase-like isoleucine patch superfamily enzyme
VSQRTPAEQLGRILGAFRRAVGQLWVLEARARGVEFGGPVVFNGRPIVKRAAGSRLMIGGAVTINSAVRANVLACARPTVLHTMNAGAELVLERGVGISGSAILAARSVRIGEGTILGADCMVFDNDFHAPEGEWNWTPAAAPDNPRAVVIGRGVFIGTRAIVLKGVMIGDRAIIGAGAVVTRDVPSRHLAFGNPAQIRPLKN